MMEFRRKNENHSGELSLKMDLVCFPLLLSSSSYKLKF